jgi:hypothetical protein
MLVTLGACQKTENGHAKGIPPGNPSVPTDGSQKTTGEPPIYDSSRWTVGTYWTWIDATVPHSSSCIRWQVLKNDINDGVLFESRKSLTCKNFELVTPTKLHVIPTTGEVDLIAYGDGPFQSPAQITKIFDRLFGNRDKTDFFIKIQKTTWGNFSTYRLDKNNSWYLQSKNTHLNGALLISEKWRLVDFSK